jgi:activator of HSP90 ATPase
MSIHQEVSFPSTPARIFTLLTDEAQLAAATGLPAKMGVGEGASFCLFDGRIEGRHIELVPGRRVVQAWRGADWQPGVYSIVRFTLEPDGTGTKLVLDQEGYPDGASPLYPSWHEHLATNWPVFYFQRFANQRPE